MPTIEMTTSNGCCEGRPPDRWKLPPWVLEYGALLFIGGPAACPSDWDPWFSWYWLPLEKFVILSCRTKNLTKTVHYTQTLICKLIHNVRKLPQLRQMESCNNFSSYCPSSDMKNRNDIAIHQVISKDESNINIKINSCP